MSTAAVPDIATIRCPKCKATIKLTDAVAAPLLETARVQFEQELAEQRKTIAADALVEARRLAKEEVDRYSAKAVEYMQETRQAKLELAERDKKLAEAQQAQAAAIRKERELDDRARELDLTIERKVSVLAAEARMSASRDADEQARLRIAEKDEQLASMARTIEDLKRKAEQGSTQLQGEAQEILLEEMLRAAFPADRIEPVAKGQFGGDAIQTVVDPSGRVAGTILWESKRTKNWTAGWLVKLRDDQRAAKADLSVLVSQAPPPDRAADRFNFELIDLIWVVQWKVVVAVAAMLRQLLIEVSAARASQEGIETKAKTVYRYLTGPMFRQRVQAVIEKSDRLREGLDKERKALTAIWAAREKDIQAVTEQMAQLYGDLSGIAGKGLPEIEGLGLALPEGK